MKLIHTDYSKIEIVDVDGVDWKDYPKFCDAYISEACIDGQEATQEQLDILNDDDQFRYESVWNFLH